MSDFCNYYVIRSFVSNRIQVRASVRNYDEDLPCNTIRAWVIGLILTTVGSGINMLFSLRNPSIYITTFVIQLVAYPRHAKSRVQHFWLEVEP